METSPGRRFVLMTMGLGVVAGAAGFAALPDGVASAAEPSLLPPEAKSLEDLAARLSRARRRRDFKTVPMILNDPEQWDHAALAEVITYRGAPRQVWDNTGIAGPWLSVMRNSLNSQVWSFKHPDFLVVSATHGTAHLALFGPAIWEKYQLAKLTGGRFHSNTLVTAQNSSAADPKDYENPEGVFSPHDNSIPALQRPGGGPRKMESKGGKVCASRGCPSLRPGFTDCVPRGAATAAFETLPARQSCATIHRRTC